MLGKKRNQNTASPYIRKYTGPAKPVPTHIEIVSDKAERIIFLLFAIFISVLLSVE